MRQINKIIVHCADTPDNNSSINAETIRVWHTSPPPKGNGWSDIGYHWVVLRSGTIENGRKPEVIGAHVAGQNKDSLGICWVGRKTPAVNQYKSLIKFLAQLLDEYDLEVKDVYGHREFDSGKDCPGISPEQIRKDLQRFLDMNKEVKKKELKLVHIEKPLPEPKKSANISTKKVGFFAQIIAFILSFFKRV